MRQPDNNFDIAAYQPHSGSITTLQSVVALLICFVLVTVPASDCGAQSAQYKEYEIKAAFIYNFLKFVDWPKGKPAFDPAEITIGIIGQDSFGNAFDTFKDKQVKDCNVVVRRFESYQKLKDTVEKDQAELSQKVQALRKGYVFLRDQTGNIVMKPVDELPELRDQTDADKREKKIEELKKRGLLFVDPAKEENLKVIINALAKERVEALQKCHVLFICNSERAYIPDILNLTSRCSVLTVADTPGFLEAGGIVNFLLEDNKIRFDINAAAAERAKLEMRSQLLRLARSVVRYGAAGAADQASPRNGSN